MYRDKEKNRGGLKIIAAAVIAAIVILLAVSMTGKKPGDESAEAIRDAVKRTAGQCYAVEGVYPPDLKYLEDNYGLKINTDDFYVTYNAFASNLPPDVVVKVRQK